VEFQINLDESSVEISTGLGFQGGEECVMLAVHGLEAIRGDN
jgi:hypothetical protein